MKKTKLELERELAEMKIKVEDLGMTEKYRGEDVYTHMVFAEKILDLAKQAKIETTMSLGLFTLQDNLLEVLMEKVPEDQASWMLFANAIKAVEMGYIREEVQKHKERAAAPEKITTQLTILEWCTASNMVLLNSPTKLICDHLDRTKISQPVTTRADSFTSNNGNQSNLFNTPSQCTIFPTQSKLTPEEEVKVIRDSIALYPLQPMMEDGQITYDSQMNMWFQKNGHAKPTRKTGFPLCPGGAPPGSGKCYKCGIMGHWGVVCTSNNRIPKLEGDFWVICGSILDPGHQPLQVNYVAAGTTKHTWADGVTSEQSQGNGEGPSAY